jgi:hypothetical protein
MASIDIIEEVRRHIGFKPIPKIDPNTQAPEPGKSQTPDLGNAVIPALLVGFYKHTRNESQSADLLNLKDTDNILTVLFGDKRNRIIESVSNYSGVSEADGETEMKNTVSSIIEVLRKEIKDINAKGVTTFFTEQRSNILKHLPVELNMGELMDDSSVDDRTNKMEGPMSGMMHTIEKIFSTTK